ncbi:hypothetical protein DP113_21100 [Brasilonema octagenarum UFV-E1]|uniref:Uncharacterized protein n=2 Tax=Brasilonema TaxID=383614 RepID=A0A856MIQ4_9CYAN|nr:hypothetical protein [Brasilonema octagenarum UFV-OR1]QDL10070.1 hypothetical protein DP114_21175 [Brasilonema sennae CENA114]QDL16422.1 hypothetical protein DP113_21100 [Brasilonema octagenarum UFV-E1]
MDAKHTKSAKKQSVWRVARLTEFRAEAAGQGRGQERMVRAPQKAAELAQGCRRAPGRLQRRRHGIVR